MFVCIFHGNAAQNYIILCPFMENSHGALPLHDLELKMMPFKNPAATSQTTLDRTLNSMMKKTGFET